MTAGSTFSQAPHHQRTRLWRPTVHQGLPSCSVYPSLYRPRRRRVLLCGEEAQASASTNGASITSRLGKSTHYHSPPQPSSLSRGAPFSPSWTYRMPTTWCVYGIGTSGRLPSTRPAFTANIWSCHLVLPTIQLCSRPWLTSLGLGAVLSSLDE